jgi:hypothetical protein
MDVTPGAGGKKGRRALSQANSRSKRFERKGCPQKGTALNSKAREERLASA